MTTPLIIQPLIALIAGLVILFVSRVLNYGVAGCLILVGLIGLCRHLLGVAQQYAIRPARLAGPAEEVVDALAVPGAMFMGRVLEAFDGSATMGRR